MEGHKPGDHSLIHDRMHGKNVHEDMHKQNIHSDMHLGKMAHQNDPFKSHQNKKNGK